MSERLTLPIGPQHPLLKEPVHFRFQLEGEKIVDADIRLGYNHRGIEKAAEERTYIQSLYMVERICGICSHTHATNFAQTVEGLMQVEVPPRVRYLRTIMGELERIHSHLLWLGVAGHEIGFDTLFMVAWRDREIVQDLMEMISGNRVNHSLNIFGGVRKDIDEGDKDKILAGIKTLAERTLYYEKVVAEESTFIARVADVGYLPKEIAISHCAVGPTARGSGVAYDVRKDVPYAAYGEIPFKVITSERGDVLGRAIVRVEETLEAVHIIEYALKNLPDGPISIRAPRRVPAGEAVGRYEAPRGECLHYVRSNGTDIPDRVKVRAPTLANLTSIRHCLLGEQVADIPIIIAAIDPCLSCTDRTVLLQQAGETKGELLSWEELRQRSIAKRGQ